MSIRRQESITGEALGRRGPFQREKLKGTKMNMACRCERIVSFLFAIDRYAIQLSVVETMKAVWFGLVW